MKHRMTHQKRRVKMRLDRISQQDEMRSNKGRVSLGE
jgi:hypothetical protein